MDLFFFGLIMLNMQILQNTREKMRQAFPFAFFFSFLVGAVISRTVI